VSTTRRNLVHRALLGVGILLAACLLTSAFPVYFRNDDMTYMAWARAHGSPLAAFDPTQGSLFGVFRPVNTIVWWLLYRGFGLNPWPYQCVITILYVLSLVFFYSAVRRLLTPRAAVLAVVGYALVFFHLGYVIFWFSDLTFILELFFAHLALLLLLRSVQEGSGFAWGPLCYVGAIWSKEPSLAIVPAVLATASLGSWRSLDRPARRRALTLLGIVVLLGLVWSALNPCLHGRESIDFTAGLTEVVRVIAERLRFYGRALVSGLGMLLCASAIYLVGRGLWSRRSWPERWALAWLGLALLCAALLARAPEWATLLLLIAGWPLLVGRRPEAAAYVWFALPFAGILTLMFRNRTYLVEASFGLAAWLGAGLAQAGEDLRPWARRLNPRMRWVVLGILVVVVGAAGVGLRDRYARRWEALQVVSGRGQNFGELLTYIRGHSAELDLPLVLIEYDDMGIHLGRLLRGDDLDKARVQKTVETVKHLQQLLSLDGLGDVPAINYGTFRHGTSDHSATLIVMNRHEQAFADSCGCELHLLHRVEKRHEMAALYQITSPSPD
jgi:hypothetical protein